MSDPRKEGCVRCPACSFQFEGVPDEVQQQLITVRQRLETAYAQVDKANRLIEERGYRIGRLVGALREAVNSIHLGGDQLRELARAALAYDESTDQPPQSTT